MIPAAGQKVGPYEILGRLGSGGMGLVFSAWDSRLHRDVAIKILRDEYVREDSRERFLQEARAASGLNHPNICTVFDIGEQDGDPYLVMELLKGETLRGRILAGPMAAQEILQVGIDVADALVAAHARGIIHRDIKPANVFLVTKPTGGWQAKVLDFGLAKMDDDSFDSNHHMTGVGSTVGTVSYMSPEQARGEALDPRSDLFGVGILLYEMATGHVPFRGATSALVFVQLLSHPPEPLRDLNADIPRDFERIILKLLAKDRSARFQSSVELLEALRGVDLKKQSDDPSSWSSKPPPAIIPHNAEVLQPKSNSRTSGVKEELPESLAGERKPSSEVIRPIRREPLPPVTLPPSLSHWTQPPLLDNTVTSPDEYPLLSHVQKEQPPVGPAVDPAAAAVLTDSRVPDIFAYSDDDEPEMIAAVEPDHPRRWWVWAAIGAAVVLLCAGLVVWSLKKSSALPLGPATLMLSAVTNHTGDKTLDGIVLEGLRLDLAQSPHLTLTDSAATTLTDPGSSEPASLADAQREAASAGANSFLFGEIRSSAGATVLSIGIYDVASGVPTTRAEERAGSREQIVSAIDGLASQIRIGLAEPGDAVARTSVPLARDATVSLEALRAYAAGVATEGSGRPLEAMAAYQHAVLLDPKFTQAWLRLAAIYRRDHAEISAGDAATQARDVAANASERTRALAGASYELNATHDYPRALAMLDQLASTYPVDSSIQADRALLLRLQGKFPEAILAAESGLARNPYDLEASGQEEVAMLALNRVEAAVQLESQVARRGQRHAGLGLLLPFLEDSHFGAPSTPPDLGFTPLRVLTFRAQILDSTGELDEGLEDWRAAANTAEGTPALVSAASDALAQAALNRALTSDCVTASKLAREASALPRGERALFATGMAQGLCGDLNGARAAEGALLDQYPQSFSLKNYELANLKAVEQIGSGDPQAALATLQGAKCDLLSLTTYLRGLAHGAARQWPMAIADFQFILLHRGAATLTSPPVYAMAQMGLARAYAASGDEGNSAAAYKSFLDMWKAADAHSTLVAEARQHSK